MDRDGSGIRRFSNRNEATKKRSENFVPRYFETPRIALMKPSKPCHLTVKTTGHILNFGVTKERKYENDTRAKQENRPGSVRYVV